MTAIHRMLPDILLRVWKFKDCKWEPYIHPASLFIILAMSVASFIGFYLYYIWATPLQRYRVRLLLYLASGAIVFFASIHYFRDAWKSNNKIRMLCLGVAVYGYHLAVSSVIALGRTVQNRSPLMKCCQLLFGPTLIGCAAFCLGIRQPGENWGFLLPMIASAFVGKQIANAGHRRVRSSNEPRWLLFKGLELFLGGCFQFINGVMLIGYSLDFHFTVLFIVFYSVMVFYGSEDVYKSRECFLEYFEMDESVFDCILEMIAAPFVILFGCIGMIYPLGLFMMLMCTSLAWVGVLLLKSTKDLSELVPQPVYERYLHRVMGPWLIVYGCLIGVYSGFNTLLSLWTIPFLYYGIHYTNQGYRRRPL